MPFSSTHGYAIVSSGHLLHPVFSVVGEIVWSAPRVGMGLEMAAFDVPVMGVHLSFRAQCTMRFARGKIISPQPMATQNEQQTEVLLRWAVPSRKLALGHRSRP